MNTITVETTVRAPLEKVWECWNSPDHIVHWAFASDDWEALSPENDLREGGTFKTVMAAKDKSSQFDFGGIYTVVQKHSHIEYMLGDERHVAITFEPTDDGVHIIETFDPEHTNSNEKQRSGWQAILDNFKKYTESL